MTAAALASMDLAGSGLQQLIDDAAEAGGGRVRIPAGEYLLSDSLRLRSGVHVIADGETLLRQPPTVSSALLDIVGYGHREFRVADPDPFRVGMGVAIREDRSGGFGVTVAHIIDRSGDTFFTDTPCHRDYHPDQGATATTHFPIVAGYRIQDASVRGLTIEGAAADGDAARLDGCRGGGVFLLGCERIDLRQLTVRHYGGDALSFQQCIDTAVIDCHLHHNTGHGLHPGSGSVRYVMRGNRVHDNGGCGIYYCLRTTHSDCLRNQLHDNGQAGISIGERDTDHLVEANDIRRSGKAGVEFRRPVIEGGDRVIVRGNTFESNGRAESLSAQVEVSAGVRDVFILSNTFLSQASSAQAIRMAGDGGGAYVHDDATADIPLPSVGPSSLGASGGKHLGVVDLAPWRDPK